MLTTPVWKAFCRCCSYCDTFVASSASTDSVIPCPAQILQALKLGVTLQYQKNSSLRDEGVEDLQFGYAEVYVAGKVVGEAVVRTLRTLRELRLESSLGMLPVRLSVEMVRFSSLSSILISRGRVPKRGTRVTLGEITTIMFVINARYGP
ncbi:glycosyl transferase [Sesbania bispinosa]|nr:glycosyl transferase [Sesbania bispinosa]